MHSNGSPATGISELIGAAYWYRRTVVGVLLVFVGLAATIAVLKPDVWAATVKIWVHDQTSSLRTASNFDGDPTARLSTLSNILREVIYSRPVLEQTLREVDTSLASIDSSPDTRGGKKLDRASAALRDAVRVRRGLRGNVIQDRDNGLVMPGNCMIAWRPVIQVLGSRIRTVCNQ